MWVLDLKGKFGILSSAISETKWNGLLIDFGIETNFFVDLVTFSNHHSQPIEKNQDKNNWNNQFFPADSRIIQKKRERKRYLLFDERSESGETYFS